MLCRAKAVFALPPPNRDRASSGSTTVCALRGLPSRLFSTARRPSAEVATTRPSSAKPRRCTARPPLRALPRPVRPGRAVPPGPFLMAWIAARRAERLPAGRARRVERLLDPPPHRRLADERLLLRGQLVFELRGAAARSFALRLRSRADLLRTRLRLRDQRARPVPPLLDCPDQGAENLFGVPAGSIRSPREGHDDRHHEAEDGHRLGIARSRMIIPAASGFSAIVPAPRPDETLGEPVPMARAHGDRPCRAIGRRWCTAARAPVPRRRLLRSSATRPRRWRTAREHDDQERFFVSLQHAYKFLKGRTICRPRDKTWKRTPRGPGAGPRWWRR